MSAFKTIRRYGRWIRKTSNAVWIAVLTVAGYYVGFRDGAKVPPPIINVTPTPVYVSPSVSHTEIKPTPFHVDFRIYDYQTAKDLHSRLKIEEGITPPLPATKPTTQRYTPPAWQQTKSAGVVELEVRESESRPTIRLPQP